MLVFSKKKKKILYYLKEGSVCLYHIKQDLNHGFNITILNSKIKITVVQISY